MTAKLAADDLVRRRGDPRNRVHVVDSHDIACARGDVARVWPSTFDRLEHDVSRPISVEPVLVPRPAAGVLSGLFQPRAAVAGWLVMAAATAMAVPAYSQSLPL